MQSVDGIDDLDEPPELLVMHPMSGIQACMNPVVNPQFVDVDPCLCVNEDIGVTDGFVVDDDDVNNSFVVDDDDNHDTVNGDIGNHDIDGVVIENDDYNGGFDEIVEDDDDIYDEDDGSDSDDEGGSVSDYDSSSHSDYEDVDHDVDDYDDGNMAYYSGFDYPDENPMVVDDNLAEEFVEFDPTGRYGRYAELLGKGAMKTVYRAYDMVDCKEVAWNKAKPPLEGPDEMAIAIQREIHLLQRLNHRGIIKLYSSWVDNSTGYTNLITELCSSTLLAFRLKHKYVSRKAVRCWGRQILKGLVHLHTQNPPIIHRDLKCENVFVKCRGNTALKIGDFGSATVLDATHHMHTVVGTPEFMAPEMFQEDYNELVDIYSFGMCMLELLTCECPYSECNNLAQVYKKVTMGEKPQALKKVKDVQALHLINRCLLPASERPSASELLSDPFLQYRHTYPSSQGPNHVMKSSRSMPDLRRPVSNIKKKKSVCSDHGISKDADRCHQVTEGNSQSITQQAPDKVCTTPICSRSVSMNRNYSVMGTWEEENTLHLRIRIQHSSASCDIDFPFDLRCDTPNSVAEEMVRTFNYPVSDVSIIADLISKELASSGVPGFSKTVLQQDDEGLLFNTDAAEDSGSYASHGNESAPAPVMQKEENANASDWPEDMDTTLFEQIGNASDSPGQVDIGIIEQNSDALDCPEEVGTGIAMRQERRSADWHEEVGAAIDLEGYESGTSDSAANEFKELLVEEIHNPTGHVAEFPALSKAEIARSRLLGWDGGAGQPLNEDATFMSSDNHTASARFSDSTETSHNVSLHETAEDLGPSKQSCGQISLNRVQSFAASILDGKRGYMSIVSSPLQRDAAEEPNPYSQEPIATSLNRNPHQSSSKKFKQLPLGIGILLRPPTEQGLRRPVPLYVK